LRFDAEYERAAKIPISKRQIPRLRLDYERWSILPTWPAKGFEGGELWQVSAPID
jgi:hypothetical protein